MLFRDKRKEKCKFSERRSLYVVISTRYVSSSFVDSYESYEHQPMRTIFKCGEEKVWIFGIWKTIFVSSFRQVPNNFQIQKIIFEVVITRANTYFECRDIHCVWVIFFRWVRCPFRNPGLDVCVLRHALIKMA